MNFTFYPNRNAVTTEVGHSLNLPALLCFHNPAMILTARINNQMTKFHKGKAAKSAHKPFY